MLNREYGEYMIRDVERWSGMPPSSPWAKWFGGVVAPVFLIWHGIRSIIRQEAVMPGRYNSLDLSGLDAVLMGSSLLALALFLFAHYFCGNSRRFMPLHYCGKLAGLLGFCISFIWLVARVFESAFC